MLVSALLFALTTTTLLVTNSERILPARQSCTRWPNRGAARSASRRSAIVVCLIGATAFLGATGCASFGRRRHNAEAVAAARDLSRQGVEALESGQWQQAEDVLRRGLEASPDDAEIHRNLAEALWHKGATNEALSQIATATRLDPNNAAVAVRAGEMALDAGAREAALQRADEAIRIDPQLATAWALRGRAYRQLDQPDRALADLQRSLVFGPNCSDVLLEVANIYRERGEPARCLTTLYHLHDCYPAGQEPQNTLALEGLTLMDLRRPHQASEVFLAATQRGPASADLYYYLAQAQSACGQNAEATAAAQQALAVDASHQRSQELLTQLASRPSEADSQRR